jgi:hypothetical protein
VVERVGRLLGALQTGPGARVPPTPAVGGGGEEGGEEAVGRAAQDQLRIAQRGGGVL